MRDDLGLSKGGGGGDGEKREKPGGEPAGAAAGCGGAGEREVSGMMPGCRVGPSAEVGSVVGDAGSGWVMTRQL